MANAMKALPEYREVMAKLSQHMHISHQCMDLFKELGLLNLSDLEQTLATGKDEDGRVPKLNDLVDLVEDELRAAPDALTRLRLLGILIVSQDGIRSKDKDRLLTAARFTPKAARTLQNLQKMDCPLIQRKESSKLRSIFGQRAASSSLNESESEYSSSRYVCLLKSIMQKMSENSLSIEEFPSVVPMPDMGSSSGTAASARRGGTATSRWAKQPSGSNRSGGKGGGTRQIVFVAGGVCYSELRATSEMSNTSDKEFIIGGTRFVNPRQFVRELSTL